MLCQQYGSIVTITMAAHRELLSEWYAYDGKLFFRMNYRVRGKRWNIKKNIKNMTNFYLMEKKMDTLG